MTLSTPEFSDQQLENICETANIIACECPAYLVWLLREVRKFRRYTVECINRFPEDAENHRWLDGQAIRVEALLSEIIFEFMEREELLNDQRQLDLEKLAQRSYIAALRQQNLQPEEAS